MRKKKRLIIFCGAIGAMLLLWFAVNPPGKFGYCCYAYTTYSSVPRPLRDIQVRADGEVRNVGKKHDLAYEDIEWLLAAAPKVLIIAIGWDGVTRPDKRIKDIDTCQVHILKTDAARRLYNELKKAGTRVAIHYHSTC